MTDEQKQLIIDYKIVFNSEHGRRVYEHLQKWSGYEDRIPPQESPEDTAFILGKREMFLFIKDKVEANPDVEPQTEAETESEDE